MCNFVFENNSSVLGEEPPQNDISTDEGSDSEVEELVPDSDKTVGIGVESPPVETLQAPLRAGHYMGEQRGDEGMRITTEVGGYWVQQGTSCQHPQETHFSQSYPQHYHPQFTPYNTNTPQNIMHHSAYTSTSYTPYSYLNQSPIPFPPSHLGYHYIASPPPPILTPGTSAVEDSLPAVLAWAGSRPTNESQKLRAVASFIRKELFMSPTQFLLEIIECKDNDSEIKEYKSKFYTGSSIPHLLNSISTNHKQGWPKLDEWFEKRALKLVLDRVDKEMTVLTSEFVVTMKDIKPEQLLNFNIESEVFQVIKSDLPWLHQILIRAAQSNRAMVENKDKNPIPPCIVIHMQLCNLRSNKSILFQAALAYNFFGLGVPKQVMNFLSACGLTVGYTSVHKAHKHLSLEMLRLARPVAQRPHVWTCDNIEISTSNHVEQRDLGPPKVISGTTIIIYDAPYASSSACLSKPIQERREQCNVITYENDIRPTRSMLQDMRSHLIRQIVQILFEYCEEFRDYQDRGSPLFSHKIHRAHPKGFKTHQSVLRTIPVSEGSTNGCIEVIINSYIKQLLFGVDGLNGVVRPSTNDLCTNSLIRGGQLVRKKDISDLYRLEPFQLGPGLFHFELNMLWAILLTHRGKSTDLGSLQYYITLLRFTRLNSDHPDFYTLKSFVRRVLVAHILQCWETECGFDSLGEYAASNPCPDCLLDLASNILKKYASSPGDDGNGEDGEDQIFANFKLLNRDLLYFFELSAAVSAGDFGRVELFLGTYLEMFTGAGCKNYSTELLHFIQNLKKVWGPFADVMRDSMIVNLSGRDGHAIGRDMNIEHVNNIQKAHLFAKGMHASFETLGDLAPCIPIHSALCRKFAEFIGTWQGTNHTKPDISGHIRTIMAKMRDEEALIYKPGRKADNKTGDIQSKGQFILMNRGIKRFAEKYIASVQRGEEFEDEEDEIPENPLITDADDDETDAL